MAWAALAAALMGLGALTWIAWGGGLGIKALGLLFLSAGLLWFGRRRLDKASRGPVDTVFKLVFTVAASVALLRHPIEVEGQGRMALFDAIGQFIGAVDPNTFLFWALVATLIKLVGVVSSAYAWNLLLVGQGIRMPFWQTTMSGFLLGRFIGTFMPSTIGLDGYTLYEAARYSNQGARAVTAKALEKFIGVTGLFLGMVLTLPFGYSVIIEVAEKAGRPDSAPMLAAAIALVAGGISAAVVLGLVYPGVLVAVVHLFGRLPVIGSRLDAYVQRFAEAVGAYRGKVGLLFVALFMKFVTHFTTAMVYYFTALAIGVDDAGFWPIVFGSTIQILGTVLAPTIAGEGAREAMQALLLSGHLGGVPQAVLSGALGFIAAEAATLWGGVFLFTRTPTWRPSFCEVDGAQVDYAWIDGDDGGFSADKVAALQRG